MTNENKIVTPFPEDNELLGTWVFNDSIESLRSATFNIRFESKSTKYNTIEWQSFDMLYKIDYSETIVCSRGVWTDNAYKTIKITDIQNLTNKMEFWNFLKQNATKQETPPTQVSNKAISLENLKTFKQECDKVYASKDEIITAKVDCSHQYEITGNTGDEHGLAIEDQQMLINKIQGHSRRKSLNLMQDKNESVGSVQFSISKSVLTINGTTNSDTTWFGIPVDYLPTNFVFSTFNTSAVNDCDILFMRGGTPIDYISNLPKNSVKKLSNIESISIRLNGNGKTFSNVKIPIMINEGTTALPFQPYDNTLVNSNNTLISTGRNILNPDDFGARCSTYDKSTGVATLVAGPEMSGKVLVPGHYFAPKTQYSFIFRGKSSSSIGQYSQIRIVYTDKTYNEPLFNDGLATYVSSPGMTIEKVVGTWADGTTTLYLNECAIIKGADQEFEPYKEDTITSIGSLGEFDYILPQSNQRVIQTSQIITLNGSEEWNLNESAPNKQRFVTYPKIQTIDTSSEINLVANNLTPTTTAEIWINTEKNNLIGAQNTRVEIVKREFTTAAQLKQWLAQNPIQLVYKLNTPTIEDYSMPSGMAVYNGGMQIQQGDLPYTITKQYNLSQKSQILANIEIDREQAKMIDETNQKFNLIPKFSHVDITLPETSMNGTLTEEEFKILQANDLNYIIFANEIYSLNDKTHTADTLTYSHVGFENGKHLLKTISITVSTRAWVLNTTEVSSGGSGGSSGTTGQEFGYTLKCNSYYKSILAFGGKLTHERNGVVQDWYGWHEVPVATDVIIENALMFIITGNYSTSVDEGFIFNVNGVLVNNDEIDSLKPNVLYFIKSNTTIWTRD